MQDPIQVIAKYPNGTLLRIRWSNGDMMMGSIDTIYETDNMLELDDVNYCEYYACLVRVQKAVTKTNRWKTGSLVELSPFESFAEISLSDGKIIWKAC